MRTFGRKPIERLSFESLETRHLLAVTLEMGEITDGSIDSQGEVDEFHFDASAGSVVDLMMTGIPRQAGFRARAMVFAPSGNRVDSFLASQGNRRLALRENGTYTVHVRDDDLHQMGDYTVGLEGISPISPSPSLIAKGGIVAGAIEEPTEKDQLIFEATAGSIVDLSMTSVASHGPFHARAEVFSPSGGRIDSFLAGQGNRRLTLPETGVYMLQVRDDQSVSIGNYAIGWEGLAPRSPNPSRLVKGGIVAGAIQQPIEKDQLTFAAGAGDVVDLIMSSVANRGSFRARAEVFSPSGARIDSFLFSQGNRRLSLHETGTYMVQVRADNSAALGSYSLGWEGIVPFSPDVVLLTSRQTTTGEISRPTEKDQFVFHVTRGTTVELSATDTVIDNGFRARAEVFAPSGNRIDSFVASQGDRRFVAAESGTYMIQIRDDHSQSRGVYSVRADFGAPLPRKPGDFDGDGALSAADIDRLTTALFWGVQLKIYDLNGDGHVNPDDRIRWIKESRTTYLGDANLDGEFSSGDFVFVFQAGEYEDGAPENSTWATGDWNGDLEFDTADFVAAFQDGGFERGPLRTTVADHAMDLPDFDVVDPRIASAIEALYHRDLNRERV